MEINLKHRINLANLLCAGAICMGTATATHAAILINEIDYDQPGSDTAEFIELFNSNLNTVSLDGYVLDLVNGSSGSIYSSYDLSGLSITAQGYFVLCDNTAAVANCDHDIGSSSWIQNGGADGDAIALTQAGTLVDAVTYENTGSYLGYYAEGNSFTTDDSNSIIMSIARLPDGFDSDFNASDFGSACITPGSANISGTGDCSVSVSPVPVPAAVWLFGTGLVGLIGMARRQSGLPG
jgi:predicted extracellular nuclease